MDVLLDAFIGVLENEIDLYRSLLLVLQQEKESVVFSKLKELDESSKEKEIALDDGIINLYFCVKWLKV